MAQVEIIGEEETPGGWAFQAHVLDEAGGLRRQRVALSWADYNHWSRGGTDEPARVAEAVLRYLLDRLPADQLGKVHDASIARRMFPDADEVIPGLIG